MTGVLTIVILSVILFALIITVVDMEEEDSGK